MLPIATDAKKRPAYDFLVYNASVVYWQIARQLMKKSTFQFLAPSLAAIIDTLKLVKEEDVLWVARLQMALVHALIDGGQLPTAAKTVNEVVDERLAPLVANPAWSTDGDLRALFDEALCLQVHVGSLKDAECQKIVPVVKKAIQSSPNAKRLALLVKLQCLKSGNLQGTAEEAYAEIFQDATGMSAFSVATTTEADARAFAAALDSTALGAVDAEILIEAAIHGGLGGFWRFASCCNAVIEQKRKSMQPRHRLHHQVLKVLIDGSISQDQQRLSVQQRQQAAVLRRIEGVKALERTLLAVKRLGDQNLAERVCMLTWNLALPLLQPHLRVQVERALNLASTTLEDQGSLLLEFRARLYLEVAKLDAALDFLVKANASAAKALRLDYGLVTHQSPQAISIDDLCAHSREWTSRRVDLQLTWVRRTTQAKIAPENTHEPGDSVFIMLEQIKDSKDKKQQKLLVLRCRETLTKLEQSELESVDAVVLMMLWSQVATAAWRVLTDSELARETIARTLDTFFPAEKQDTPLLLSRACNVKSAMMCEVDLRLLLAEVVGHDIKSLRDRVHNGGKSPTRSRTNGSAHAAASLLDAEAGNKLNREVFIFGIQHGTDQPTAVDNERTDGGEEVASDGGDIAVRAMSLKLELVANLAAAVVAATRIGWALVLENTCVYLWNYHFHVFLMLLEEERRSGDKFTHERILPECVSAFEAAFLALEASEVEVSPDLFCCLALGLCTLYEKSSRWDKVAGTADAVFKRIARGSLAEEGLGGTGRSFSVLHLKQFAEIKARAQVAQNAKEVAFPDSWAPSLKIVGFLEAMESLSQPPDGSAASGTTVPDKAQAYFEKAVALWQAVGPQLRSELQDRKCPWSLEECQQHTELLTEVWVRIGFGALRLRYPRHAIECAAQALVPMSDAETKAHGVNPSWKALVVNSTHAWFALAEFLYSAGILGLVHGQNVPQKLVCGVSSRLAQASKYAMVGGVKSLIVKACELMWNGYLRSDLADPDAEVESDGSHDGDYLQGLQENLTRLLSLLHQTPRRTTQAAAFYGDMILLTLDICERRDDWARAFQVASDALPSSRSDPSSTTVPPKVVQQIQTVYAIAAINTGKSALSSSGGGARQRDGNDPVLQSQILKQIAMASSKDPPAQFKLLMTAHSELQGLKGEQALVLMDVAEWLLTNCFPAQDAISYLDSATAMLLSSEQADLMRSTTAQSRRTASSRHLPTNATPATGSKSEQEQHPPLWYVEGLLRAFMVKVVISGDLAQRTSSVELALHQVERAWRILIDLANELDLQSSFVQAKATGGAALAALEFDAWRTTASLKFSAPHSSSEWMSFVLQHEKSVESRFFMPWAQALQPVLASGSKAITDAGLTLHHLDSLVTMLQRDGRFELILPVLGLYQVLLSAAIPRKTYSAGLWADLTLFIAMERLQMTSALSVPLQSALAIVNSQGAKIVQELKESLSTLYRQQPGDGPTARVRGMLPHSATDSVKNTLSSVSLLLDMGFVRQAKGLLDVALSAVSATNLEGVREVSKKCQLLASRILEVEGKSVLALAKTQHTTAGGTPLQLVNYLDWALCKSKYAATIKEKLGILEEASSKGVKAMLLYVEADQRQSSLISSKAGLFTAEKIITKAMPPSLEASEALARVKFKQATVQLKQLSSTAQSGTIDTTKVLDSSKTAFEDARRMLWSISAFSLCGKLTLRYAELLGCLGEHGGALVDKTELRRLVREAIELIERGTENVEHRLWRPSSSALQVGSTSAMPWEIEVAVAKLRAASAEIELESTSTVVEAYEMTWYEFVQNSQRSVVEKWLTQTDPRTVSPEGGDLAYAMTLVAWASSVAERTVGVAEFKVLAQVLGVQCRRLAVCHSQGRHRADSLCRLLWTSFGSPSVTEAYESHQETWICAHAGSEGSLPAEEGDHDGDDQGARDKAILTLLDSSVATLLGCQRTALELRSVALARRSAYELVQVLGCRRPFESAMNLLMYQSCEACDHMQSLLHSCLEPSSVQSLHLRRMKRLSKFHSNAPSNSLPFQLSQLYMDQQSDAFKRMTLGTTPVDAIVAALPPSYRIVSLQFSPEKCFLYAVLVAAGSDKRCTMSRMEFTRDHAAVLDDLVKRLEVWRASIPTLLIGLEEELSRDETFDFVGMTVPPVLSLTSERDALEKELSAIIRETVELFQPLFSHPALQAEMKSELPGNSLVLLVDRALSVLPLESLPFFDGAESIARDFSIHMLHHRVSAVKTQPVRRDEVRTVVDPHKDDSGSASGHSMESVVRQHCKAPGASLQWKDAVEHGQIPSVTDWQHALAARRGGSLVYVGPNRIVGSSLPLPQLARMNLAASCHVLLLLDQAENVTSSRRQSKCDNGKPAWQLRIEEDAYLRALLLSLVGVNAVVLTQWATTFSGNRRLANALLQGLAKGQSVGRALRAYGDTTLSLSPGVATGGSTTTNSSSSLPSGSSPPSHTSSASALASPDSSVASSGGARAGGKMRLKNRLRFNTVAYGLAHLGLKAGE